MSRPTIMVTGASRGLGEAIAQELAKLGASVVMTARTEEDLRQGAGKIEAAGGKALIIPGDLSSEDDCKAVIQLTVETMGGIDGLINNGGTVEPIAPIAEADFEGWRKNWEVNVIGAVMLVHFALPYLRERRGKIVNITSGTADYAVGGWGAYSSSKAALNLLTKVLAKEEPEITTVAVRPGTVDTDMQAVIRERGKNRMTEENYRYLAGMHERGQLLPPEIPAQAIAYLALYTPHNWSGEIVKWDEERVQQLVETAT